MPRPVLIFDVNETLLDLESLSPFFKRMFGEPQVMREWFAQVILYSQTLTITDVYVDFGKIGAAVLKMLGKIKSIEIDDQDVRDLKDAISRMPPHSDVRASLQRLKQAGFRMVTLTNNAMVTADAQLQHGAIGDFFERTFSVDDGVHRYKPASECYEIVASELGVERAECVLIACHTWDILGAASAGMRSALVMRAGNATLEVGRQPDFVGNDLTAVVDWLCSESI